MRRGRRAWGAALASVTWALSLVLSLPASSPGAVDALLFKEIEKGGHWTAQSARHEAVLRSEAVDIVWEAVKDCDTEVLELGFFVDVRLIAVRHRTERSPTGGCAWIGGVVEPVDGEAVIVMEGGKLSGTVTLDDRVYHVRPLDNGHYVVREMERKALEPAGSGFARSALSLEQQVLALVNQERAIEGLYALMEDNRLDNAALAHSNDMARNNYFSHDSLDGRSPWDRIEEHGYSCGVGGENIAAGYSTPEAVMAGWMTSSGHRANILSPQFCDVGVGYGYGATSDYKHYWTQDFGREAGATGCDSTETYTIIATSLRGGEIAPSGRVEVDPEGSQTFTITPNSGYRIRRVLVDGVPVGRGRTYTFSHVMSDHTITARFIRKPTINLTVRDGSATERPFDKGKLRVTRTGSTNTSLRVRYTVGGTATAGADYRSLSGSVKIRAGSRGATIVIFPFDDSEAEESETVTLTLKANPNYIVGSTSSATVTIAGSD